MRCLTLAQSLVSYGTDVLFVCADVAGHLGELIAGRGFVLQLIPARPDVGGGGAWANDAEQTRAVLAKQPGRKVDWLVVDHYQFDYRWESSLRACPEVDRIMVIDDLCNRSHDCDMLLDQNLVADMYTRYTGKVPEACRQLIGPRYALLNSAYSKLHDCAVPRRGVIRRLIVFFGGVDSANLTSRAMDAFEAAGYADVQMDVVIGASNPHRATIAHKAQGKANITLHTSLPSLASLMSQADLALGAGGVTHWERLCLGLPCLVVTLSDNQRASSQELHRRGLIDWLGHHDAVDVSRIAQALKVRLDEGLPVEWSQRCLRMVDGLGAERVWDALTDVPRPALKARAATVADETLLLAWANDPVTRLNAFSSEPISAASHSVWLQGKLSDPANTKLYIVEWAEGLTVGQVRFDRHDVGWLLDYSVAPGLRGQGWGRKVLEIALVCLSTEMFGVTILGWVKSGNLPSMKVFESLGFEQIDGGGTPQPAVCYRLMI
jgi:UDP-2,4-diacetamido-2,4,6-trideoxy-beta-L-altropyranose hydrolase